MLIRQIRIIENLILCWSLIVYSCSLVFSIHKANSRIPANNKIHGCSSPQIKWCSVVNPLRYGFSICRFRGKTHRYRRVTAYMCVYVHVCVDVHTHTHLMCHEPWEPWLIPLPTSAHWIYGIFTLPITESTMAFRFSLSIKIILTSYCLSLQAGIWRMFFPDFFTSSLQSYIYSAKISIHFINISISPECLSCILRVSMGSWHGFQKAYLGAWDMLPRLLCVFFKCQRSLAHPRQLVERHSLTEESAQAHLSFMLLLCPIVKHLRGLLFSWWLIPKTVFVESKRELLIDS